MAEFTKISQTEVTSTNGFRVKIAGKGAVQYYEGDIHVYIASEFTGKEDGVIISRTSKFNRGLEVLDENDIERIFANIVRALNFLGYSVKFWEEAKKVSNLPQPVHRRIARVSAILFFLALLVLICAAFIYLW